VRGLAQHGFSAEAEAQLVGQVFARALLSALAQRPDPLEPEREGRSLHEQCDRQMRKNL
jgi:hypothetical protein